MHRYLSPWYRKTLPNFMYSFSTLKKTGCKYFGPISPANIYLLRVINRNTRKLCKIRSYSQYQPYPPPPPLSSPPFRWEGQPSVPNFEKREGVRKKNECLGELKKFLPWIFAWGWGVEGSRLKCFLSKKAF